MSDSRPLGQSGVSPTIYVEQVVEGDGRVVDRLSIGGIYASREAARADGVDRIYAFTLNDDGCYVAPGGWR